jgi:hypothetical protein
MDRYSGSLAVALRLNHSDTPSVRPQSTPDLTPGAGCGASTFAVTTARPPTELPVLSASHPDDRSTVRPWQRPQQRRPPSTPTRRVRAPRRASRADSSPPVHRPPAPVRPGAAVLANPDLSGQPPGALGWRINFGWGLMPDPTCRPTTSPRWAFCSLLPGSASMPGDRCADTVGWPPDHRSWRRRLRHLQHQPGVERGQSTATDYDDVGDALRGGSRLVGTDPAMPAPAVILTARSRARVQP